MKIIEVNNFDEAFRHTDSLVDKFRAGIITNELIHRDGGNGESLLILTEGEETVLVIHVLPRN
jgi:hypothetical protein